MVSGRGCDTRGVYNYPWCRALRIAIGACDAATVVQVLEAELPNDGLQLAGDGLLLALAGDAAPAAELSRRCAAALDARSWEGDVELATALRAAMGDTAARSGTMRHHR